MHNLSSSRHSEQNNFHSLRSVALPLPPPCMCRNVALCLIIKDMSVCWPTVCFTFLAEQCMRSIMQIVQIIIIGAATFSKQLWNVWQHKRRPNERRNKGPAESSTCRFTQLNGGRTIKALVPGHKGKLQLYLPQFVIVGTGITILPLSNSPPPWVMTKLAPNVGGDWMEREK